MLCLDFLKKGAARFPDRALVELDGAAISYREMEALADRVASALIGEGVKPGDRVATYTPNRPWGLACQYGALRAGAVWVPLNFRNTAEETRNILEGYGAAFVFYDISLAAHLSEIERVQTLRGAVCLDQRFEAWLTKHDLYAGFPEPDSRAPAVILTTSGTTGRPKGAVHSHSSWETMIASFQIAMPFDAPPVHLVAAPLTHAAGCLHWTVLSQGGTNVLLPKPDPLAILEGIETHKANLIFLPPTVIYMMLAHPDLQGHDYSSLRYFLYGAAPMAVEKLREALKAFGPVMAQAYGQSEALMMCTYLTPGDHAQIVADPALQHRIASAGREGPLVRVEIMGDGGTLLPPGEQGEIVCRSGFVMDGYYDNPNATEEVSRHGWHHTGDVGVKDPDGFIYVVDRKRDMIISGGFNLFPSEIEQTVLAHPSVQDCAVVGVPDEKWGEAVLAAVELKPGADWDEAAFLAFCKERLGSLKTPKRAEVWPEMPRSTVGKTLRREVRAHYWKNEGRQI